MSRTDGVIPPEPWSNNEVCLGLQKAGAEIHKRIVTSFPRCFEQFMRQSPKTMAAAELKISNKILFYKYPLTFLVSTIRHVVKHPVYLWVNIIPQ